MRALWRRSHTPATDSVQPAPPTHDPASSRAKADQPPARTRSASVRDCRLRCYACPLSPECRHAPRAPASPTHRETARTVYAGGCPHTSDRTAARRTARPPAVPATSRTRTGSARARPPGAQRPGPSAARSTKAADNTNGAPGRTQPGGSAIAAAHGHCSSLPSRWSCRVLPPAWRAHTAWHAPQSGRTACGGADRPASAGLTRRQCLRAAATARPTAARRRWSFARLIHHCRPRPLHAGVNQPLMEARPRSRAAIVPDNLAGQALAVDLETENIIESCDIAFHAADVGDLDHAPHAVTLALDLHDQIYRPDDLGQDRARRQYHVPHLHHVLDPRQGVPRGVRMNRGHAPVMPGVHRLQHVERFGTADLAQDDAIRSHPQCVANQVALCHLAATLQAGDPGLQSHHMRLLQLQLGCVLNGDNAL